MSLVHGLNGLVTDDYGADLSLSVIDPLNPCSTPYSKLRLIVYATATSAQKTLVHGFDGSMTDEDRSDPSLSVINPSNPCSTLLKIQPNGSSQIGFYFRLLFTPIAPRNPPRHHQVISRKAHRSEQQRARRLRPLPQQHQQANRPRTR